MSKKQKRYTIAEKRGYLRRFSSFTGNQKEFCQLEGIGESAFCKWKKNATKISERLETNKHLHRSSLFQHKSKLSVLRWAREQVAVGAQVNTLVVLDYIETMCPELIANASSYNSRHHCARRLLLEMSSTLEADEIQAASTALLQCRSIRVESKAISVHDLAHIYSHGDENRDVGCITRNIVDEEEKEPLPEYTLCYYY